MKFKEYLSENEEFYIDINTNLQVIDYFNTFNEIFNRSADIKVTNNTNNSFNTSFVINDVKYIFMTKIEDKEAVILFHPLDDEIDMFKERKNSKAYLGELFGSLIQSVRLMLKEYDINTIGFTAENKKLESIYNLLNKTIQKRFPGWELKDIVKNNQGKLNYTYIRKD